MTDHISKSICAKMPKSRIRWCWNDLKRLVIRLAEIRGKDIVDICTDTKSREAILKSFIMEINKDEKKKRSGLTCKFIAGNQVVSPFGFTYDSYDCGGVTLNLLSDKWFNDYSAVRKKRGWKPMALSLDWKDIDVNSVSVGDRNRHRVIYQK